MHHNISACLLYTSNKRAVENLIKAGALDGLDGNRQQMITVFSTIMDNLASEKKKSMSGQMTLFDLVPEEEKMCIRDRPERALRSIPRCKNYRLGTGICGSALKPLYFRPFPAG